MKRAEVTEKILTAKRLKELTWEEIAKKIGGAYVFADFGSKRVWLHKSGAGKIQQPQRLAGGATSFGVDDRGEIYAVTYDGVLHRMRVVRR